MTKILFVAGEGLPYIKSGGLADVIGSLPQILVREGYDVRVILPLYQKVRDKYLDTFTKIGTKQINAGWINQPATYYQAEANGVIYYFVEHQGYFERDQLYGYGDDDARFGFFQKASLDLFYVADWFPDIIHCHDWHTGMIPLLGRSLYIDERIQRIKYVYTIHNLAFQGNFGPETLWNCLGLDYYYYENGSVRFDGGISFLKTGVLFADKVTTVSPTYAQEILTPQFGERMDEVLRYRYDDLVGIVNGIDTVMWDPAKDAKIAYNFDAETVLEGKKQNKLAILKQLGMNETPDTLLIGIVSRLTNQKGVYMITERMNEIMGLDVQFVILGTGETAAEDAFTWLENNYKGRACYYNGYNDDLAHQIYASCDLFLMPSIYEPCGIGQLNAMRYGSLPLVRETGGLKDTVQPYNQYTQEGNGFSFWAANADDMMYTIRWAVEQYYNNPEGWETLVQHAMATDVSWEASAKEYDKLYKDLMGE